MYARPAEPTLSVDRKDVEGACPECGAETLQRYPAVSFDGWSIVVKCQCCLYSVSREAGPWLGGLELLEDAL